MKKLTFLLSLFLLSVLSYGQKKEPLTIYIHKDISTHFISPEPIQYVDISTDDVAGDIPVASILRVKPKNGKPALGVVTIVGERFMVQYKLSYASSSENAQPEVRIDPTQVDAFINPAVAMSTEDMQHFALLAVQEKPRVTHVHNTKQKVEIRLNNIYTVGDYFFMDVSMKNKTNIAYDIDQIRFLIEDKKVVKATNFQQLEMEPVFALYDTASFKRRYRNVFVFRKFTFPDEKVFHMEVAEEQVSGRTISLKVNYRDVLNADTL
ncbi:conjugative transposon TraN protein [Pontibacter ummariensis]|uniref:Bacteroides conjugative transposon TraN protein n=1 Tax=Pontibacter ummariensis TaxID=1610492 RepID=A0A239DW35_9BACT|nr:conjugative transposon protein TraN [Pontibacter ummariensis]PRY13760.1 conjugative transposon TraN protein [Pontibacter ummariensis]SNS35814.1 Bacteroides conjugative transposon TraN protein [Pontibacter ummariensis]